MTTRRTFLRVAAAASLVGPRVAAAQNVRRVVIAAISAASERTALRYTEGLREGMRDLGYVDGQNLELVWRYADGDLNRLPQIADELVGLNPAVIVASNTPAGLAVKQRTATTPIVVVAMSDPVTVGLAANMARPGGNVTGQLNYIDSLPGKLLEFGVRLTPGETRVGVLVNPANPVSAAYMQDAQRAASTLNLRLEPFDAGTPESLGPAFAAVAARGVRLALVLQDAMFLNERARVTALAAQQRVPTVYPYREYVEEGGLLSYGINVRESFRRAAALVDRIFKGARPAEMPLVLPDTFELVVNLKAAAGLGLAVPQPVLALADEVIE